MTKKVVSISYCAFLHCTVDFNLIKQIFLQKCNITQSLLIFQILRLPAAFNKLTSFCLAIYDIDIEIFVVSNYKTIAFHRHCTKIVWPVIDDSRLFTTFSWIICKQFHCSDEAIIYKHGNFVDLLKTLFGEAFKHCYFFHESFYISVNSQIFYMYIKWVNRNKSI